MRRRTALFGILGCGLACGGAAPKPRRATLAESEPPQPELFLPPPPCPPGTTISADALAGRATALRERLGVRGFTVVIEPPFVVAGDEAPAEVERRAATTIHWSVKRLKDQYFAADPRVIVEVYLFSDADSYYRHARELFDDKPETPYGYYTPTHDALLMNISSGGGTLVHEIVHPFMAANFPACPSWFNEGLASLYEQCDDRDGEIVGSTNWRLPALQAAIRSKELPPLAEVLAASSDDFYAPARSGLNYAQSRYLCYYLQERGLLRDFYHQFLATVWSDPSGRALLQQVVGYPDLERFAADWREYVLGLQFG